LHTKTVIIVQDNFSFGLNNFVYLSLTSLLNVFNGFYLFNKNAPLTFLFLGVNVLYIYA